MISRMIGTPVFSDRTEFSVPTTFTYDAARAFFPDVSELVFEPCASQIDVIRKVSEEQEVFGAVPIENSVHGEVVPTLDALLFEFSGFSIIGEVSLPITFDFFVNESTAVPRIAISHPHALAQCKRFIAEFGLAEQTTSSTAEACRLVATSGDSSIGAIASPDAGKLFDLTAWRRAIEDFSGAYTRFLVLSDRPYNCKAALGDYRSMIAVLPPSSGKGILAELTGAFSSNGMNILSIHTRPIKNSLGHYVFTLTIDGSILDGPGKRAVDGLRLANYRLKVLGVYPRPTGPTPAAPYATLPGFSV